MHKLTVLITMLMIAAVMAGYGANPSSPSEPVAATNTAEASFDFSLPEGYEIADVIDKSCSIVDANGTAVGGFVLTGLTAGSVRDMDRDMEDYLCNIDESYEYISWRGGDFQHPTQNMGLDITIPGREEKKVYTRIFFVKDSGVYDMWFDCDLIDGAAISEFYPIAGDRVILF